MKIIYHWMVSLMEITFEIFYMFFLRETLQLLTLTDQTHTHRDLLFENFAIYFCLFRRIQSWNTFITLFASSNGFVFQFFIIFPICIPRVQLMIFIYDSSPNFISPDRSISRVSKKNCFNIDTSFFFFF